MLGNLQSISDAELILTLREIRRNYPATGEVMVLGHLRSLGYRVNRDRVRTAMRTIDLISTSLQGDPTHFLDPIHYGICDPL